LRLSFLYKEDSKLQNKEKEKMRRKGMEDQGERDMKTLGRWAEELTAHKD
jgi:hypothetical protein